MNKKQFIEMLDGLADDCRLDFIIADTNDNTTIEAVPEIDYRHQKDGFVEVIFNTDDFVEDPHKYDLQPQGNEIPSKEDDEEALDDLLERMVEVQAYVQGSKGLDIGDYLGPDTLADLDKFIENRKINGGYFDRAELNLCIQGYYTPEKGISK